MRYKVEFQGETEWHQSAMTPPEGFMSRAEAALSMAGRLAKDDCSMDFRIRPFDQPTSADLDAVAEESKIKEQTSKQ